MTGREHVRKIEAAIADTRAQLDEAEASLQTAKAELTKLDDMRAGATVGESSPAEVEAFAARHEAERATAEAEIDRLQGVIVALEPRLEAARAAERLDVFDEVAVAYRLECEPLAAAAMKLRGILVAAVKQAGVVDRHRSTVAQLRDDAERAAAAAGVELELVDEPAWRPMGWDHLVELVESGPLTPERDAETRRLRLQQEAELGQRNVDRQLIREVATETLNVVRLRDDEPLDDVIDRVLEARGLADRRRDVVAERGRLIREHLAQVEATYEQSEATWVAAGGTPPPRVLDEFEALWRRQNGIPVDDVVVEDDQGSLADEGVVVLDG